MNIGSNIIYREKVSSTNTIAASLMAVEDLPGGTVIHTSYQTSGRGQQGRQWESEAGMNLCMSIILYPKFLIPEEQFQISIIISLGLYDFISRHTDGVSIKWSNDLYVNDDKIAGILIEHTLLDKTIQSTIAGIGLNLNQTIFREGAPNPISLRNITNKEYDPLKALSTICKDINKWYDLLRDGDYDLINKTYHDRLYRLGEWHKYKLNNQILTACLKGIDQYGQLLLENKHGEVAAVSFNEVDFII